MKPIRGVCVTQLQITPAWAERARESQRRERNQRLATGAALLAPPSHVPFFPLYGAPSAEASAGTAFQRHHSLREGCVGTEAEA